MARLVRKHNIARMRFFSVVEVLHFGLSILDITFNRNATRETQLRKFNEQYGRSPTVLSQVWSDLVTTDIQAARLDLSEQNELGLRSLLIAVYFMFQYPRSMASLGAAFKLHKSTVDGDSLWGWVQKIASLITLKVQWPHAHFNNPDSEKAIITVDGKDQPRQEVQFNPRRRQDKKYCSKKHSCCALKWEIGFAVHALKIVWVAGPFRGAKHDVTIYRGGEDEEGVDEQLRLHLGRTTPYTSLESMIPEGKFAIGDRGYSGGERVLLPNITDNQAVLKYMSRARARHEALNGRLFDCEIIRAKFRHSVRKQKIAFEAVVVLQQYEFDAEGELFDV